MKIQSVGYQISYTGKIPSRKGALSASTNVQKSSKSKVLANDHFKFAQTDRSFDSELLKDLFDLTKKIPFKRISCKIVKDELLKAMGYKHPDLLKLFFVARGDNPAAYMPIDGVIKIREDSLDEEEIISILRHELEHFNQDMKIYKAVGKEKFCEANLNILRQKYSDVTMANVKAMFNEHFYETMSKYACIKNFDSEKYYKALWKYPIQSDSFSINYKYYNNLLEKDAYAVEKKVLKALGREPVVAADFFPTNYKKMLGLLKNSGIPKEMHDFTLYELNILAHIDNISNPKHVAKFMKIWFDMHKHKATLEEKVWWIKTAQNIKKRSQTSESLESEQKRYQVVEEWLRKGKFTIIDACHDLISQNDI